jgi:hypothetical protein
MKGYVEFFVLLIIIVIFYSAPSMFSQFYSTLGGRIVLIGLVGYFALESSIAGILAVIMYVVLANKQLENMDNMESNDGENTTNKESDDEDKDEPKQEKVSSKSNDSVSEFRKSVCQNGALKLQGKELDDKMKSVKFIDGKCNVCDDECRFEITSTSEQLSVDEMMRPKDSNTMPIAPATKSTDEVSGVAVKTNLKEGFIGG